MSSLKMDMDYDPSEFIFDSKKSVETILDDSTIDTKELKTEIDKFIQTIKSHTTYPFFEKCLVLFKTNTNVFDSHEFIVKVNQALLASIKEKFPDKDHETLQEIRESMENMEKVVAKNLKDSKVENPLLLLLCTAALSAILDYNNY